MEKYKQEFIEFLVQSGALKFGSLTLKSGRQSPYFINTGMFQTGRQLARLGEFYAEAILNYFSPHSFNVIFGAAYKGIPLAAATSIQLADLHDMDCYWCYNRKEKKDHGEGGFLVGYKPVSLDGIILVDDVITAGTATKESIALLRSECLGAMIRGQVISVDRMERGQNSEQSAIQEIRDEFGFEVIAIVNLDEIVVYLHNKEISGEIILNDQIFESIKVYRAQYGAKY